MRSVSMLISSITARSHKIFYLFDSALGKLVLESVVSQVNARVEYCDLDTGLHTSPSKLCKKGLREPLEVMEPIIRL